MSFVFELSANILPNPVIVNQLPNILCPWPIIQLHYETETNVCFQSYRAKYDQKNSIFQNVQLKPIYQCSVMFLQKQIKHNIYDHNYINEETNQTSSSMLNHNRYSIPFSSQQL